MNENSRRIPNEAGGQTILIRLAAFVACLMLLESCALHRSMDLPPLPDWKTRQNVLAAIPEWSFTGRIGVSAGTEGFNGKFRWHQVENGFSATVSGPLGFGAIKINGDSGHVTVINRDGEVIELTNAEDDLRAMYGWTIPVASLRYWALGIPDPASSAVVTEFDDNGRLLSLEQRNWRVKISQYRDGGGQPMPRRITAVNADAKVRLVIDRWTFF